VWESTAAEAPEGTNAGRLFCIELSVIETTLNPDVRCRGSLDMAELLAVMEVMGKAHDGPV
jgi:hypothetical protein